MDNTKKIGNTVYEDSENLKQATLSKWSHMQGGQFWVLKNK